LNEKINKREADLVKLSTSKFQTKTSLIGNWKSSKKRLSENDLAIEFSHFKLTTNNKVTDDIMYVAYLYKSNWNAPVMIPLFEEEELKKIISNNSKNELYNSNNLYNLIWEPFEEHLELSNNVYFSPSGLLNQISFAAIKNNESTLSANYNLVQLSSTGVLAEGITEPEIDNTLFIGGITYEYNNDNKTKTIDSSFAYLNSERFKSLRGTKTRGESWTYLPNTLKEIENLQSILNSDQKTSYSLTASEAKESVFKEESGNSAKLLHIATHGFFFENNSSTSNDLSFGLSTEDLYRSAEDPLLRSGLIMAGANYAWKHGNNPFEEDDGILNALEISNLDLSNTDIVVLSACETGLGDIDGSEGVYGLQRAFKMAGVDIIVMSLWKVPDAETAEFMTLFYTNWIELKNVRKAFNKTQRTMQKKYGNQPENWAAFVMFE
jgi:CHAT domain-containing protein